MKTLAIWTVVLLGAGVGHADEPANTEKAENTVKVEAVVDPIGYSDEDRDGRNDRFHDADGDGNVNVVDLLAVIGVWGTDDPIGDLDGSGLVDVTDMLLVVGNWGPCE